MTEEAKDRNRRKSERVEVSFSLIYSIEKPYELRISLGLAQEVSAIMLDLSDLGMAIITKYDIPASAQLHIRFKLMNLQLVGEKRIRNMDIYAETVSNISLVDGSHRIGIRFDKISEEDKNAIRDLVNGRI